jgi:hypothetical protein
MFVGNQVDTTRRSAGKHVGHDYIFSRDESEIRMRHAKILSIIKVKAKGLKWAVVDQFADFLFCHAHVSSLIGSRQNDKRRLILPPCAADGEGDYGDGGNGDYDSCEQQMLGKAAGDEEQLDGAPDNQGVILRIGF